MKQYDVPCTPFEPYKQVSLVNPEIGSSIRTTNPIGYNSYTKRIWTNRMKEPNYPLANIQSNLNTGPLKYTNYGKIGRRILYQSPLVSGGKFLPEGEI